jgi:hypothetical protein
MRHILKPFAAEQLSEPEPSVIAEEVSTPEGYVSFSSASEAMYLYQTARWGSTYLSGRCISGG